MGGELVWGAGERGEESPHHRARGVMPRPGGLFRPDRTVGRLERGR